LRVAATEHIEIDVAGRSVRLSSPSKVMFPEHGQTKLDLVNYYLAVGDAFMSAVGGRPLMMERYPDGASGKSFFQKRVPASPPEWLQTTVVATPNGTESNALVAADMAHVIWAVNLGCLGFHVWPCRAADAEHADELRIDLDPTPGVTFEMVRESAFELKTLLDEVGMSSYPKTTGNRGLHVYIRLRPEYSGYEVRAAAVAVARELERRRGDLITAAWWKEERGKRVFVDFNQNAPHKTVFGAWSVRPRVGAQVSMPLTWDAVRTVDPQVITMDTVPAVLARDGDAWATIDDALNDLSPLLEWSARDMANGMMDAPWPPVYPKMPNEPPRVAPSRAKKTE
jgi:DNA ligase D